MHTPDFKTQVVLAILKGDKTRLEVCSQFGINPTQADKWKSKVLVGLPTLFTEGKNDLLKERDSLIEELYKQIGQLKVELDWLKKRWDLSVSEKAKLIDRNNPEISVRKQCALLQLNRSDFYYQPKPAISIEDKLVMDEIDRIYTQCPFYGWPKITKQLKLNGL